MIWIMLGSLFPFPLAGEPSPSKKDFLPFNAPNMKNELILEQK
jgi:hypothetical protein